MTERGDGSDSIQFTEIMRIVKGGVFVGGKKISEEEWQKIKEGWDESEKISEKRSEIRVFKKLEVIEECKKRIGGNPLEWGVFYESLQYELPRDLIDNLDGCDEVGWNAFDKESRELVISYFSKLKPDPSLLKDLPENQKHYHNLDGKTVSEMSDEELYKFVSGWGFDIACLQEYTQYLKENCGENMEPFDREQYLRKFPLELSGETEKDDPFMFELNLLYTEQEYYQGVGGYHETKFKTLDEYIDYNKKYRGSSWNYRWDYRYSLEIRRPKPPTPK